MWSWRENIRQPGGLSHCWGFKISNLNLKQAFQLPDCFHDQLLQLTLAVSQQIRGNISLCSPMPSSWRELSSRPATVRHVETLVTAMKFRYTFQKFLELAQLTSKYSKVEKSSGHVWIIIGKQNASGAGGSSFLPQNFTVRPSSFKVFGFSILGFS